MLFLLLPYVLGPACLVGLVTGFQKAAMQSMNSFLPGPTLLTRSPLLNLHVSNPRRPSVACPNSAAAARKLFLVQRP